MHEVSRRAAVGMFLSVAALTAGPPLAAFFEHGSLGIFRYFSADAFYYLAVADHSIGAPFFTFDGSHPTNGFHPLWQWLLAASFAALDLAPERQIVFTFGVSVALTALGTGLFALVILRRTQRPALALLGAVPGFFYPIVAGLNPHVGSSWSFANGMESSLSVFWLGILLTAWTGRRTLGPGAPALNLLISSALLTLVTLSRLDDIFLFAPFLLLVFATAGSRQEGIRRAGLASAIPFVVIGAYLVWNVLAAGSWLPSSGLTKAQPLWGLARNGYALVTTLAPFADTREGPDVWASEAWRVAQMVLPALLAGWWLATRPLPLRRGESDAARWRNAPLALLAGYTILKCGYNFSMVSLWHQGEWYYPLCILTFNALLADILSDALDRRARPSRLAARGPRLGQHGVATALALVVSVAAAAGVVQMKRGTKWHARYHAFWSERAETRDRLEAACPGCGVLSFDDGIVSYSLEGTATLNGLGLTMDAEARRALSEGRLLELAWSRGHPLLVSVEYGMPAAAYTSPASLHRHLEASRHLAREDLTGWDFEVAFRSRVSGVHFVRFRPRAAPGASR